MKTPCFKTGILVLTALSLAACGNDTKTPTQTNTIKPAQNKMVVLPANMSLGSAVIHPPRAVDGFGNTEAQTIGAFNGLHNLLQKQGLTFANVMRVRVILVADTDGVVDYDGYMSAYKKFFGTKKFPNEPLNIMSAANSLPVSGQSVLIEVDIAVPQKPAPDTMTENSKKKDGK